jgi:glycerol-3-phosphate dehydrogenase
MGRCQGGFCMPQVLEILAEELNLKPEEITKKGGDSQILFGTVKGGEQ